MNFAKKQSDNVEQQEAEPSTLPSPLGLLSLLRPRSAPTELQALVADEPEDLDTEDEGLISFEEERVSWSASHAPAQRLGLQDPSEGTSCGYTCFLESWDREGLVHAKDTSGCGGNWGGQKPNAESRTHWQL